MKRYLILALTLLIVSLAFADIEIGNGTATARFPLGSFYGYERSAALYTSTEIGMDAIRITGLGWNASQAHPISVPTKIYLKVYPNNTVTTDTWANMIGDAALVFDSTIGDIEANTWNNYNLDSTFDLDSGSNLLVMVERNYGGSGSSSGSTAPGIYATTMSNMHLTFLADTTPPTTTGSTQTTRPNIKIFATTLDATDPPNPAVAVAPLNGATMISQNPLLTWRSGGGAPTGFKLYFGTTANPALVADLGAATTYQAGPLAAESTYYWKIVPYNANGEATNCPVWSFTTLPDGMVFIGDGTTTGIYLPVNTLYNYSYSQSLYLQNEINMPGQRIEKIAYYWNGLGNGTNNNQWTIYMGHTDANSFATTTDWVPIESLSQVFSGTVNFPTAAGWMEIVLSSPFVYNNTQNLVIATVEDSPGYTNQGSFFNTVAAGRSLRYQSDSIIPNPASPPSGIIQGHYPNIMMLFGELPESPVLTVSPTNINFGQLVHAAPSVPRNIVLTNTGAGTLSLPASAISLMGANANEFSFNAANFPLALTPGQSANLPVQATPTTVGEISAVLRIVYEGQNYDVALSAQGMPAGLVFIGDGNSNQYLPVNAYYGYTYSQSIYMQNEINTPDQRIEKIAYYWNGMGVGTNTSEWVVYMGHTDQSVFSAPENWIPINQLTQVYSGTLNIPATAGWIEIILDNPFVYNNVQNLVIAVDENRPAYDGSAQFFFSTLTTGQYRSIRYYSDGTNPDPANPPTGTVIAAYPNIRIEMGELPESPILTHNPSSLDFGTIFQGAATPWKNVFLTNTGAGVLNIPATSISIIGTHAEMFEFETTNLPFALGPGISGTLHVRANATTEGALSATLRIVYAGENHDVALSAEALPAGMVIIGEGTASQRQPFGHYFGYERSAGLYPFQQLGLVGLLDTVAWQCATTSSTAVPYKIYLGTTAEDAFVAQTWTDFTANLTLVKEGTHTFSTTGWHSFSLDEPFAYMGQNLIVAVETNYGGSGTSPYAYFNYTTSETNSNMNWYADSNPPTNSGYLGNLRPNLMLHIVPATGDPVFSVNPASYDFGDVNIGGSKAKSFNITNMGGSDLIINSITISGSNTFALSTLPTLPATLGTGQIASFIVTYTPNAQGTNEATVTITDNLGRSHTLGAASGSLRQANREAHTVALTGAGVNDINIGDGGQTARMPMDFFYKASLYQNIYTADEMGNFIGMITGLKLYTQFTSNLSEKPVKIWLGNTTQTDLSAGWIPATELELVFDGTMDFPSGQNILSFNFPEPYMHLDGGNLVMMVQRPLDESYFSSTDYFKTQTGNSTRARNMMSDTTNYDPNNPTGGSTTGIYPKITFVAIPGGVGTITGTVLGDGNAPLAGVNVSVFGTSHSATTDANGQFSIIHVLPGHYSVTFSKHTYVTQALIIELEEDETEVINITMELMPRVSVSGTVLASDTGQGIAGANVRLTGYDTFSFTTSASGSFAIQNVFANQSYNYVISAQGYTSASGDINVGATTYNMGNITLAEVAYAPNSVVAEQNETYTAVNLVWNAPDPNAVEITESFEGMEFPPVGWSQVITNSSGPTAQGIYPTWCNIGTVNTGTGYITPTEGAKQAGIKWVTEHQDEWLKTMSFNCPPDAYLRFDTHATYGSTGGDHYYVKISTNGGSTWTALWDASVLPEGSNSYQTPITIDLAAYAGSEAILAFHAIDGPSQDGLWNDWFIDNVYIGNIGRILQAAQPQVSQEKAVQNSLRGLESNLDAQSNTEHSRALVGYKVWRLAAGQESNEATWVSLTDEPVSTPNYTDESWQNANNGSYKWAVKAVYTANVVSAPAISNALNKEQLTGFVVGFVRRTNGQGIPGAIITASNGTAATTNSAGNYSMVLPIGTYSFTANANGYHSLTQEDIPVVPNQNTTVNFNLISTDNEDEVLPVAATALKGNYPNPFNPETTISYELKDAAPVRLDIYNLKGQVVRSLVNTTQASGRYRIVFDGKDDRNQALPSGVYFYRFSAGEYHKTQKMMLMQ